LIRPDLKTLPGGSKKIGRRPKKIIKLIKEIQRHPFEGTGKPEALKHELNRCWSRRIDREHRLVYQVLNQKIRILACRYHY